MYLLCGQTTPGAYPKTEFGVELFDLARARSGSWRCGRVAMEGIDMMGSDDARARDLFVGELRRAIAVELDAALDERHRQHAAALFLAGRRDDEITDSLLQLRADDALRRQGLLIDIEHAVLVRLGRADRGDDADTGAHDNAKMQVQ